MGDNTSTNKAKLGNGPTLGQNPSALYPYVLEYIGETEVQRRFREEKISEPKAIAMGAPDEAAFLSWLCSLIGAKKVIEIGVFRGTTTLALAKSLPKGGVVIGVEMDRSVVGDADAYWKEAGVREKIDLRIGPAVETLAELCEEAKHLNSFDLVFIDADKVNYDAYFEFALKLLRKDGIIAVDNTLWLGRVLDPQKDDDHAIVALNEKIKKDSRVEAVMVPIADGVYFCRKK